MGAEIAVVAHLEGVVEAGGPRSGDRRVFGDEGEGRAVGPPSEAAHPFGRGRHPPGLPSRHAHDVDLGRRRRRCARGQERDPIARGREAGARKALALEGQAAVGPGGEVHGHELGVEAVLRFVGAAHHEDDRLAVRCDLRVGEMDDPGEVGEVEALRRGVRLEGLAPEETNEERPQGSRHEV